MMTCNATFGGVTCNRTSDHDGGAIARHERLNEYRSPVVSWRDDAPGAKPHEEPADRYMTEISSRFAAVVDTKTESDVATFWTGHPDRDAAAEREAARLNGDPDPRDAKIKELSERWGETIGQRNDALAERDEARAESDRLTDELQTAATELAQAAITLDGARGALHKIVAWAGASYVDHAVSLSRIEQIAREALDGEVTEEATYCNCSRREVDEEGNALHYHNCNSRGPR